MSTIVLSGIRDQRLELPARMRGESLTRYAVRLAENYANRTTHETRKKKGQFFTPDTVATFMAGLAELQQKSTIRLLDPGAGVGILSAAICDHISTLDKRIQIHVDAIENDKEVVPYLQILLAECQRACKASGQLMTFKIYDEDFESLNIFFMPSIVIRFMMNSKILRLLLEKRSK